jgi:Ca-activated chloride channel homolog
MASPPGAAMKQSLAMVIAALAVTAVAAQQPVFRSSVDVVRVDVSVMNGLTPVAGLTADNFEIVDNGVTQKIESVTRDTVPLSLTMALDTSGSLAGDRLTQLIEAANGLVRSLRPEDAAALMTFAEPVRRVVPMSTDRRPLLEALQGMEAAGATSMHDAVFLSLQVRPHDSGESRPVLLVFSDGQDTTSWLSSRQVLEVARRSSMLIHVVELTPFNRASSLSNDLARAGGGRSWMASSPRDLRELFGRVLNELRARYLLTYYPTAPAEEGWHNVKVSLKRARGDVTAREGYYVPPK